MVAEEQARRCLCWLDKQKSAHHNIAGRFEIFSSPSSCPEASKQYHAEVDCSTFFSGQDCTDMLLGVSAHKNLQVARRMGLQHPFIVPTDLTQVQSEELGLQGHNLCLILKQLLCMFGGPTNLRVDSCCFSYPS